MLIQRMVDKVNKLAQAGGDMTYLELRDYFDEAMDILNEAIHRDRYDYLPETYLVDDNYVGIPNRFQSRFMCYFVAAKVLGELDDYDAQKDEYETIWRNDLMKFISYYFDYIEDITVEKDYAFNIHNDVEVTE